MVASEMLGENSAWGGNVITKEFKEIDGYVVPWTTYTSAYTDMGYELDQGIGQTVSGDYNSNKERQQFQASSMQKVARFYTSTKNVPNEAKHLSTMVGYVGEVAITFNRGYTFQQIKDMLPKSVNLTWVYLFNDSTQSGGDSAPIAENPIGIGVQFNTTPSEQITGWRKALQAYWQYQPKTQSYKHALHYPAKQMVFKGAIVTGTTENLARIAFANYTAASSIGITVKRVPYIQVEK